MNTEWVIPTITILGAVLGSYLGVRLAITRIEVQIQQQDKMISLHDSVLDAVVHRMVIVEGDLNRMKSDIGTHETGMRGQVNDHATMLVNHELRLHMIDKQTVREL